MKKTGFSVAAAFVTLALFGGAATVVGCGGPSTSSLCSDFCACERCTSNDQQACEDGATAASDKADASGCSGQFDDVVTCALAKVTCDGNNAVVKGCEAEKTALNSCLSGANPPDKDGCQKASDQIIARLSVCAVSAAAVTPTEPMSCSAAQGTLSLCNAACFDGASCVFLKCVIDSDMASCSSMTSSETQKFSNCTSACSPPSPPPG